MWEIPTRDTLTVFTDPNVDNQGSSTDTSTVVTNPNEDNQDSDTDDTKMAPEA